MKIKPILCKEFIFETKRKPVKKVLSTQATAESCLFWIVLFKGCLLYSFLLYSLLEFHTFFHLSHIFYFVRYTVFSFQGTLREVVLKVEMIVPTTLATTVSDKVTFRETVRKIQKLAICATNRAI